MLKQLFAAAFIFIVGIGAVMAQVDVNQADQVGLDGIRGIGPTKSKQILEERKKGPFKDWNDLESRVKGIGGKSAAKLSSAGLTVNGKPRGGAAAPAKPASTPSDAKAKTKN